MELAQSPAVVHASGMGACRRLILCLGAVAIWPGFMAGATEANGETSAEASANHKLSQHVRELIRAELPRYVPKELLEEEPELDTSVGVMRDDTLHLPTMRVREARKAPPSSTDWLTGHGRTEFALKRYPGTKIGNFFGSNNPWAIARLTEDIEAERHQSLKERARSILIAETAEDRETQKLLEAALMYSGRPPPK